MVPPARSKACRTSGWSAGRAPCPEDIVEFPHMPDARFVVSKTRVVNQIASVDCPAVSGEQRIGTARKAHPAPILGPVDSAPARSTDWHYPNAPGPRRVAHTFDGQELQQPQRGFGQRKVNFLTAPVVAPVLAATGPPDAQRPEQAAYRITKGIARVHRFTVGIPEI